MNFRAAHFLTVDKRCRDRTNFIKKFPVKLGNFLKSKFEVVILYLIQY